MKIVYFAHDSQESPLGRKSALEHGGFAVQLFSTSEALRGAVEAKAPDLVLLDALLPGLDGFATAAAIRDLAGPSDFPIVLCSRIYRARCFREDARRAGCSDLILLPVTRDVFLRRIHAALEGTQPLDNAA